MDLRRVNKIPQRYKDIIYGSIKEIQRLLPANNSYFNIVDSIKYIILLYFYPALESKILTEDDKDKLFALLKANDKTIMNHPWKLIYDSSQDDFKSFVKKVYGNPNVILIVELKGKSIIGGYTKTG